MPQTDPVLQRIAEQVQRESENIDELHRSGDVLNGNLVPPPPAEKAQEPPPAPTAEAEPEGPIFGKYKDLGEAEKGYSHLLQLARQAQDERDQLKERLAAVQQSPPPAQVATPPTPKAHPSAVHDWMKQDAVVKLAEQTGIEASQLAEFAQTVYSQATERAQATVDERLAPLIAQAQAQAQFNSLHPEAQQLQAEIDAYVGALPEEKKNVIRGLGAIGQVKEAMEYVWDGFNRQRQAVAQTDLKANAQATETVRKAQKAQATLPQSQSTPIHAANDDTPDPEAMAELRERAKANDPDAQRVLRRLTFGRALPPQMRTWETQR